MIKKIIEMIKIHIETWVWKSTEMKLFTFKNFKTLKNHHKKTCA